MGAGGSHAVYPRVGMLCRDVEAAEGHVGERPPFQELLLLEVLYPPLFDGQGLSAMRRQPQLINKPGETNEGIMDVLFVVYFDVGLITFECKLPLNRLKVRAKVVLAHLPLQAEIEVFRIAGGSKKEPQRGTAMKGERHHGSVTLQDAEYSRLQVFPNITPSLQR